MSTKPLTDRAKQRLRIAADLLRGSKAAKGREAPPLPVSRQNFYEDMLQHIEALPVAQRESLKSNVDWIEAYTIASETHGANPVFGGKKNP